MHRITSLSQQTDEGVGWGTANRIPGWPTPEEETNLQNGWITEMDGLPYGVAADAQVLRIVAPVAGITSLRLSEYGGLTDSSEKRWGEPEIFAPPGVWRNYQISAASSPLIGGTLAVAWVAQPAATITQGTPTPPLPQVFLSARQIAPAAAPEPAPVTFLSKATDIPAATPTVVLTATPVIAVQPQGRQLPVDPLVLGSGLAALIVVAIFIGILVQGQGRGRS